MQRALVLLVLLVAAGCGGDRGGGDTGPPAAGAPIPGGGLTVEEAIASDLDGPLMVKGALVVERDQVRLCGALAESYPPQCGGPWLRVVGIDLAEFDLESASGVSWNENVSLLGTVDDGVIRVSETSRR